MRRLRLKDLVAGLGSLAGVTYTACAYGIPQGRYVVDGVVVDADTEEPVAGIQVDLEGAATITAEDGTWAFDYTDDMEPVAATATDVDGAENGSYESASVQLELENTAPGEDAWDSGTWEQHDVRIALPVLADTGSD